MSVICNVGTPLRRLPGPAGALSRSFSTKFQEAKHSGALAWAGGLPAIFIGLGATLLGLWVPLRMGQSPPPELFRARSAKCNSILR